MVGSVILVQHVFIACFYLRGLFVFKIVVC